MGGNFSVLLNMRGKDTDCKSVYISSRGGLVGFSFTLLAYHAQ